MRLEIYWAHCLSTIELCNSLFSTLRLVFAQNNKRFSIIKVNFLSIVSLLLLRVTTMRVIWLITLGWTFPHNLSAEQSSWRLQVHRYSTPTNQWFHNPILPYARIRTQKALTSSALPLPPCCTP
jgi:hypothetical protein